MDTVILTGASGFIGRHCINHLLDAGYCVHALYNRARAAAELPQHEHLSWQQVDLLDAKQVSSVITGLAATHLLHLAWYAEPGKFWDSRLNLDWLRAGVHLVKTFAEAGGKRFVGAGTCAEYDWSQATLIEDSTPLNPATLYGTCKSSLFQSLQQQALSSGLEYAWGRIFWLYGPGEDRRRLVPYVINALLSDDEANCTEGLQERDYLYVEDVARAFARLLQSSLSGAVNIASGEAVSVKSLVCTIAQLIDREQLVQFGAIQAERSEPALLVADTKRLNSELNFQPEYNLERGCLLSLEWWRKERNRSAGQLAF